MYIGWFRKKIEKAVLQIVLLNSSLGTGRVFLLNNKSLLEEIFLEWFN